MSDAPKTGPTIRVVAPDGATMHKFVDAIQYAVIAQCPDGKIYCQGRFFSPDTARDLLNVGLDELYLKGKIKMVLMELQQGVVAAREGDVPNIVGRINGVGK